MYGDDRITVMEIIMIKMSMVTILLILTHPIDREDGRYQIVAQVRNLDLFVFYSV